MSDYDRLQLLYFCSKSNDLLLQASVQHLQLLGFLVQIFYPFLLARSASAGRCSVTLKELLPFNLWLFVIWFATTPEREREMTIEF